MKELLNRVCKYAKLLLRTVVSHIIVRCDSRFIHLQDTVCSDSVISENNFKEDLMVQKIWIKAKPKQTAEQVFTECEEAILALQDKFKYGSGSLRISKGYKVDDTIAVHARVVVTMNLGRPTAAVEVYLIMIQWPKKEERAKEETSNDT